jgi:NAD(P)-dependent dehydrogenase (short-subunit alcohol dehydrogenase family)
MLESLNQPYRAAVIGASGGIGRALTQCLVEDENAAQVFAFSRTPLGISDAKLTSERIDILDEDSIAQTAEIATADGALDLVLVTTGVLHRGPDLKPEKAIRETDGARMAEVIAINTIGPSLVAKHFLPTLRRGQKTVFAALSARVGSIEDNRLGGWVSYRASKAALNMVLRTFAIEHARQRPESIVAGLHPGTVDTALSQPFSGRVPESQLFSAARSARHLLRVIEALTPEDSGGVFAWDGKRIPG